MNVTDQGIKEVLENYKKFVVCGLSPDKAKPSHSVPLFMKSQGYEPVGTYPKPFELPGIKIYPDLRSVPAEYRKFVDVFRSSDNIPKIVDEVLALGGTEVLWLQLGITHPEAEKRAEAAGLKVISNRCLHIEHERLFGTR